MADDLPRYCEAVEQKEELDEKMQRTDDLVDELVCEFYRLSDEEIEVALTEMSQSVVSIRCHTTR